MPLTTGTPPKACDRLASEAIRGLTDGGAEGGEPAIAGGAGADIALPHEVYAMGLDDVIGGDLGKARRTGWRYLVVRGDRAVAAAVIDAPEGKSRMQFSHVNSGPFVEETVNAVSQAEGLEAVVRGDRAVAAAVIDAPEGKSRMQFSHVNSGPFVEETVNAVSQAEGLEAVARGDYEVRLLNIPALYVMALWLHGEADDLLLPMPPTNESLDAKKVYTPSDLLKRLKRAAQARSAFDDTPRTGAKAGRPA
jgi:hypothetical protein